jgi:D-glycero-D-manno-heptose 1,7-bisphosphate phosphatase
LTAAPSTGRPAVFLDRDGVLNHAPVVDGHPRSPRSPAAFRLLEDVREPCNLLSQAGFALIVVTNQPEVARGTLSAAHLGEMHSLLRRQLPIDDIYTCPHDDADGCECRKPRPGLIRRASREHGIDLAASYLVGDRWKDVAAGRRAGCRTVFVDRGYDEPCPESPTFTSSGLLDAALWILAQPTTLREGTQCTTSLT